MTSRKLLPLIVLAALAAAGCGRMTTVQAPTTIKASATHVLAVSGIQRKLGYDVERFQQVLAPQAHPVHLAHTAALPTSVDNRQFCSPIADQGQLGSCTAFSMGRGLREYLQKKSGGAVTTMSALWLYYNERAHMGPQYVTQDSGDMADGMFVLGNQGCAPETSWPYDISKLAIKPPADADAAAPQYKVTNVQSLATFDDAKTAIAAGKPVAFGFTVYLRFQFIGSNGIMPMPWSFEPVEGGHAVLAVGYDDAKQLLTVRNSWGAGWGDHGYFYMPYKFAQDSTRAMEWFTADSN